MDIKIGCDILQIKKFQDAFEKHPEKFRRDIFSVSELKNSDPEHLAGLFAAKEAILKALDIKPGHWKLIEIKKLPSGKPFVVLSPKISKKDIIIIDVRRIVSSDISISHHGEYVIAVAVFLIK